VARDSWTQCLLFVRLRPCISAIGCCLLFLTAAVARADLQLQDYDEARHLRFYTGTGKAFIGDVYGVDFSGVGRANTSGTWATMVSPRYFVSAVHYHPAAGETITFYEDNTTANGAHTYTVGSGVIIKTGDSNSDLWLGQLTASIPGTDNIDYYPVLQLSETSAYLHKQIFVYGKLHRVGLNSIDAIGPFSYSGSLTQVMEYDFDDPGGMGADEAYLIGGDSGAPSFALWNNQLALVGTHYYNSGTPGENGDVSGDSFVPYYISELNSSMVGDQLWVVPEPGTVVMLLGMLGAGLVGWFWRQGRMRR